MTIKIVKSNASGFPIPAIPSRYNDIEGATTPVNVLEGVYENASAFSVDITIQEEDLSGELPVYIDVPVTQVISSNPPFGITISKQGSNIRISGSPSKIFTDSFYQFVMQDKSVKILPADNTESTLKLIRWSPPSTKIAYDVPYVINFKYSSNGIEIPETITILQDIYWDYGVAITEFRNVLAKETQ